jgi:hypothetical protein
MRDVLCAIKLLIISQHTQEFLHILLLVVATLHGVEGHARTFVKVLDLKLSCEVRKFTEFVDLLEMHI